MLMVRSTSIWDLPSPDRDREIKDSRNVPRKFSRNLSPAKIKENKVFIERFLHQPLERCLHFLVVIWFLLKSNIPWLKGTYHCFFFNIFDYLCCRYKWLCQYYLFEQRNLYGPNQWLQLQLLSRICRQPMRNWLDTCCCYLHCVSPKNGTCCVSF